MGYRLRVNEVMAEKGVSMGMLMRGTGLPRETVRKLVRAPIDYSPNMDTLIKVAQFLGVTLNDLYEVTEDHETT